MKLGTFRKRGDTWRAEVSKGGTRESKTFATKREAQEWAASRETELATTAVGGVVVKTLAQVLERFRDEVSPKNKGHRWERVRIDRSLKDEPDLCAKPIHAVTTVDLAAWRDKRLAQCSPHPAGAISPSCVPPGATPGRNGTTARMTLGWR